MSSVSIVGAVDEDPEEPRVESIKISELCCFLNASYAGVLDNIFCERLVTTHHSPGDPRDLVGLESQELSQCLSHALGLFLIAQV